MKKIKIKINGQAITCDEGATIGHAAWAGGIEIPGLCFHPDLSVKANCRVCVVEIIGRPKLATSCSTPAQDGMEILTDSDRVKRSRNLNLEMIFAEHIEKCPTCVWRLSCQLLAYAERYKIEIKRFPDRKAKRKTYKFANAVELDGSQCIDCRNCLDACDDLQKINFLRLKGKGMNQEIAPASELGGWPFFGGKKERVDCVYCGQCAVHCPVGAAQEQLDYAPVEKELADKDRVAVAQFAPSIRVSIGEEFGLPAGKIATGQLIAGLKQLGFNYVFDVNFGADITTMVEADELLERLKSRQGLPMITACCPAWVKYVEFYRPDLIPNLTTARSPHLHSAGLIKTFWAEQLKIKPKNITVVSVMPCTAKKFEAARIEMKINGAYPVDYVLTTRELAYLFKKNKIDFAKLKPAAADNPLGNSSGAAAIYGATGGVMESALRAAEYLLGAGKKKKSGLKLGSSRLEFTQARGLAGVKEAALELAGKKLRIAVVNGLGNVKPVLAKLENYDYVEVMACPDGCIGGGGQPIPTNAAIRKKRLAALYKIDARSKIRQAHENRQALAALEWLENKGKLRAGVLYTKYKKR
ncbi:MAG: [FeFe] hydrogenase, group A [bacterium]|nr:[FeFe] hydrogenase, group A [bacterium]